MKKYNVNVNGTMYEVEIELVSDDGAAAPAAKAPSAAPAQAASTPKKAPAPAAAKSGTTVSAPMPGTILSVNVSSGAKVKAGQVLFILEAMKMENEIMAPCDGTIASVNVQQGSTCETGAALCVIA